MSFMRFLGHYVKEGYIAQWISYITCRHGMLLVYKIRDPLRHNASCRRSPTLHETHLNTDQASITRDDNGTNHLQIRNQNLHLGSHSYSILRLERLREEEIKTQPHPPFESSSASSSASDPESESSELRSELGKPVLEPTIGSWQNWQMQIHTLFPFLLQSSSIHLSWLVYDKRHPRHNR